MTLSNLIVNLPAIVITDLDGTLLDHHTYDWKPAKNMLKVLQSKNIPVVFNTSKTRAELEFWRHETDNQHPFIVENGSAIYIPKNSTTTSNENTDFDVIELGVKRDTILTWLKTEGEAYREDFTHFAQLTVNELVALTDLPPAQAALALQREYSEAIQWRGAESKRNDFIQQLRASGFQVLIGGRFLHILGHTDKGKASQVLVDTLLERHYFKPNSPNNDSTLTTIACGDSQNDVDMLNWADIAILIRSPQKKDPPKIHNPNYLVSNHTGPTGWAETLNKLQFLN